MVVPMGADLGGAAVSVMRATIGRPDGSGVLGRVAAERRQGAHGTAPVTPRKAKKQVIKLNVNFYFPTCNLPGDMLEWHQNRILTGFDRG